MALVGHAARGTPQTLQSRMMLAIWLIAAAFAVLSWRLYSLQILRGEELASKGRDNFVQRIEVLHDRGIIYDRYGRILVDNRPSLDLTVTPHFLGDAATTQETLERIAGYVGLSDGELAAVTQTVIGKRGLERFRPLVVARDLDPHQVETIEADRSIFLLDGVDIVEGRRRTYRYGAAAAHLLGYVNEIGPGRLAAEKRRGNPLKYERGDLIGRDGIEHRYEDDLRGFDGWEKVVVDAKGRRMHGEYVDILLGPERRYEPQPGHNVFLSIDIDLQLAAEAAFASSEGRAGSVVAMDPRDGSVLALVSVPAFDPNLVSGALAKEEKARLDSDPLKPWLNRAIQGQYAPGSTFKVVTGLAALMHRVTSPSEKVRCPGYYRMGRRAWRCHKDSGHGLVNMTQAYKVSCDTYFYTMAARVGINRLAAVGSMLGMGRRTGIRIRGEKPGLMPDEAFHDRADAATGGYQKGMVLNTAIGQGAVLVTPLQLASLYATFANRGRILTPKTLVRVETADFRVIHRTLGSSRIAEMVAADELEIAIGSFGEELEELEDVEEIEEITGTPPTVVTDGEEGYEMELAISPDKWRAIHVGLVAVTSERGGTAYWRRSRKVTMAGKTGTSQVIRLGKERLKMHEMPYEERDHAWFAAYAPADVPEIIVAVVNEHSGHGGTHAEPIAVKVIDAYFDLAESRRPRAALGSRQATESDPATTGGPPSSPGHNGEQTP